MRTSSSTTISLILVLCLCPAIAAGQTEESNRVFAQINPGTLALVAYNAEEKEIGRGTAFALADDLLVTAYHLVSKAASVKAVNMKGKEMKVEGIIAVDKASDVAILKLKGKAQALAMGTVDAMKEGARIFAVGTNEGGQITNTEGTVRRTIDVGGQLKFLEMSLAFANTFCGAPLTDFAGQVVGMILVLDRSLKAGLPVNVFMNVFQNAARTAKPTTFEAWPKEDYFEILEGALLCGRLAAKLDDLTTARLNLEKVTRLNPNQVEAQAVLADVYLRQRDYAAAIPAFQKALELDGSQADVAYGLGIALVRTQKFAEAAAAMEKAITLNVAAKEVFFDLGSVYEQLRDFGKAADAYVRFLETKPVNPANGYLRLGTCRMELQQYEEAVEALLEAQKIQPQDIKTNYSLAEALWKSAKLDLAE
ncbi:MAG: tetratricopeptide repeat protein, partial [Candidatus Aminicenantes bacterium]|nr:tetratricopeptide repeat protein [Candidatus Aminicenantes bacterium]